MRHSYDFLGRQMGFAHPLQSPNTYGQLKNHGVVQTEITHLAKCWLQTRGLTNWLLLEQTS
jgi:hypothetical protein